MGQILSEPVTTKDTASCQNSKFRVGSSCMQGWRVTMEDAHTHILSLPDDPGTAFFGVYDGHGGSKISQYAGKHLHKFVVKEPLYKKGHIADGLKQAFLDFDSNMLKDDNLKYEQAGSTAIVVLVKGAKVYCANVGDSRAVACVQGLSRPLSCDHKPTNTTEYNRIKAAGGWVDSNRVNGNLALSRALGDFVFKRNEKRSPRDQIVTAYPDVEVVTLTPNWEFIVLACDGIWDVMTSQEVVDFVRNHMAACIEPEEICESLMMKCLAPDFQNAGIGCDNMSVVIVACLHGGTYEDLCYKCRTISKADKSDVQDEKVKDDEEIDKEDDDEGKEEEEEGTQTDGTNNNGDEGKVEEVNTN